MIRLNHKILSQVTGEFGVLEVINSGSCFELPKETLEEIRILIQTKRLRNYFLKATGCIVKNCRKCEIIWGFLLCSK